MIFLIINRKFDREELSILKDIEKCSVIEKNDNIIFGKAIEFLTQLF